MSVYNNYLNTLSNIDTIAARYGRNPKDITLLTVSKSRPLSQIEELAAHGVKLFGESRVQDAIPKIEALDGKFENLSFHFIGNIQTNKIKKMIGRFDLVHSVDNVASMRYINGYASESDKRQNILIQLNLAKEVQKGGVYEEDLDELIDNIKLFKNIVLKGFMIIQPYEDSKRHTAEYFKKAYKIFDNYRKLIAEIDILSMGMSGDYEEAIAEGATMVRLGSCIFND